MREKFRLEIFQANASSPQVASQIDRMLREGSKKWLAAQYDFIDQMHNDLPDGARQRWLALLAEPLQKSMEAEFESFGPGKSQAVEKLKRFRGSTKWRERTARLRREATAMRRQRLEVLEIDPKRDLSHLFR